MGRKSKAKKYYEKFLLWQQEKLENKDYSIESRQQADGRIRKYRSSKKELLSFRQCYTNDKTARFYQVRHQLPQYWFVSDKGTLVTCKYREPKLIIPAMSGANKKREQYEISDCRKGMRSEVDGINLDPATLVALTFGGNASTKAEALMKQFGLLALKQKYDAKTKKRSKGLVELHHEEGYKYGTDRKELEKNRAYNCDIDRTQFLTIREHLFLTNMLPVDADLEKSAKEMSKLSDIGVQVPTFYISNGARAGSIIEAKHIELYKDESGKTKVSYDGTERTIADIPLIMIEYEVQIHLYNKSKKKIIRGVDIPADIYDFIVQAVAETMKHSRIPLNQLHSIVDTPDKEIYYMITQ